MLRKVSALCVFYFVLNIKASAQPVPFQISFGDSLLNEFGISVIQLSSGSIYLCGYRYNAQFLTEISLTKLDMSGNVLWQQFYGDSAQSYTSAKMILYNNLFYIAGQTMYSAGNVDALVLNTDTSGNLVWEKKYGSASVNESFAGIEADPGFGFMCSGFATGSAGSGNDIYIARLDTVGNLNWAANYGTLLNDVSMAIKRTPDGNFILSGDKLIAAATYNAYVLKSDSAGNTIWDQDIVSIYNSGCRNIMVIHNGDYILVGESATPTSSYFDILVSKITGAGSVSWAKTIPATDHGDAGFSIIEPVPDNYLITGYGYNVTDSSTDIVLIHMDSAGNEISKRYYNFGSIDLGFEISPSIYGGFLITGTNYGLDNQYCLIYDTLMIPVNVHELPGNFSSFRSYPNIIGNKNVIHFNKELSGFSVSIIDPSGKIIYNENIKEISKQYRFKTSFQSGFYILKIAAADFNYSQKIIFDE